MKHLVMPGGEPFYFPGGKIGILCVHGFVGTPDEIRRMGMNFAQRGYTVLGIRLFGHATRARDMQRAHWQDWLANVEDGLTILSSVCEHIYICGLSMGGVLSLLATASYSAIEGAVVMSTPMHLLPHWLELPVSAIARCFPMLHPMRYRRWFPRRIRNQVDLMTAETIGYWDISPHAFGELLKMLHLTRACLPKITVPVLVIHSHQDRVVNFRSGPSIEQALTCPGRQHLWLDTSPHTIPDGPENRLVFDTADQFIQQNLKG